MVTPGWAEPTGSFPKGFSPILQLAEELDGETIHYELLRAPAFKVGYLASLMVLQGMPLHQLFTGVLREKSGSSVTHLIAGKWLYLEGTASSAYEPLVLHDVQLVRQVTPITNKQAGRFLVKLLRKHVDT